MSEIAFVAAFLAIVLLIAVAAHFWTESKIAYRWIDMLEARGRYQQEEIQHQQETIRLLRKELLSETEQVGQVIQ